MQRSILAFRAILGMTSMALGGFSSGCSAAETPTENGTQESPLTQGWGGPDGPGGGPIEPEDPVYVEPVVDCNAHHVRSAEWTAVGDGSHRLRVVFEDLAVTGTAPPIVRGVMRGPTGTLRCSVYASLPEDLQRSGKSWEAV